MAEKHIYKIIFMNQNQVYEVYAKSVFQGDLYGFIVIEDFLFGEKSAIVVDPTEDKLRHEFEHVSRSFIPMHEVIRIDQVKRQGTPKIVSANTGDASKTNVTPLYGPKKD
ncbi:DUF1820 family protein [methane-oxidizing endosymbiont of Gigantopelta aegis]|uniref:DUF1820 family protein n=1 Tax=methane-oxidizing endosymbiont of Gigantopelta aegis TaxID=2794938 RepID=UPI0018DC5371|nr:DUF1820 family protein [methane-oxidizing endosymbiont of Gigantopelta aegis]